MEELSKESHLSRLVISSQGFVFDPFDRRGYTAKEVAKFIIDQVIKYGFG
ncbi:MAG: hypothetical protein GY699_26215 [Desulfobacteraceae bacterium]|nr:hypothetical protein [Desulfobacteraceae bacterium]